MASSTWGLAHGYTSKSVLTSLLLGLFFPLIITRISVPQVAIFYTLVTSLAIKGTVAQR